MIESNISQKLEPPSEGQLYSTVSPTSRLHNLKGVNNSSTYEGRRLTFGSLSVLASLVEDEEDNGDDDNDEHSDDAADDCSNAARYGRKVE